MSTVEFGEWWATEVERGHLSRQVGLFSSHSWIQTLIGTYGFKIEVSVARRDGRVLASILFSEIEDIRGRRIISLPFSDYCDPIAADAETWAELVAPILARGAPARFRCLNNAVPCSDARFTRTEGAYWHGIDLSRSEAEIWSGLRSTVHRNIARARRVGVRVEEGMSLDHVHRFYRLHCHTRKYKHKLLPQPFTFFENLHHNFANEQKLVVMHAKIDGADVAGTFFLIHRDTLYYKFNASIDQSSRPNDLLIWDGIMLGKKLGLAKFDFGASDKAQPGLVAFKRKFASEEQSISELRSSPPGYSDRRGDEAGHVLSRMTELLTSPEVPDSVARAAGDDLYRYFC